MICRILFGSYEIILPVISFYKFFCLNDDGKVEKSSQGSKRKQEQIARTAESLYIVCCCQKVFLKMLDMTMIKMQKERAE